MPAHTIIAVAVAVQQNEVETLAGAIVQPITHCRETRRPSTGRMRRTGVPVAESGIAVPGDQPRNATGSPEQPDLFALPVGPCEEPREQRVAFVRREEARHVQPGFRYTARPTARIFPGVLLCVDGSDFVDLSNKVAVITGGASGLGRATAEMVINEGGKVALFDLNEDLVEQTAGELGAAAAPFVVNVADEESVQKAVGRVMEKFGAIHVNVNCAGIGAAARTLSRDGAMPLKTFNFVIQVNLVGTFNTLRVCAEQMQQNDPGPDDERGVIINTASVAAFDGQIGQAAYSASKAGVAGMTLPIARDLARSGIRVCTIAPGIFETPMMAGAPDRVRDPLIEMVQFPKRLGNAPEYALLARQIIENRYLNGETIRLDGGIRMAAK